MVVRESREVTGSTGRWWELTAGRGNVRPFFSYHRTCRLLVSALWRPLHQRGIDTMLTIAHVRRGTTDTTTGGERTRALSHDRPAERKLPAVSAARWSGGAHRGARAGWSAPRLQGGGVIAATLLCRKSPTRHPAAPPTGLIPSKHTRCSTTKQHRGQQPVWWCLNIATFDFQIRHSKKHPLARP